MAKTVRAMPDSLQRGEIPFQYAGLSWLQSLADSLGRLSDFHDIDLVIESPGTRFASLFEWVSFVSIADQILRRPHVRSVQIDFRDPGYSLLPIKNFLAHKEADPKHNLHDPDLRYTEHLFDLVGFLQSIGTRSVLKQSHSSFFYRGMTPDMLTFRSVHTNSEFSTVVLGITRIESREDSRRFLDEERIRQWRENMGQQYSRSPLFQFDEIWRVLSHELAVNTWEHSGATGFLAARVVRPMKNGDILPFARVSYSESIQQNLATMGDCLEICVADAGKGIVATLEESFKARTNLPDAPRATEVLAFAFDELGTRKSLQESWITERHALGRILNMVSKYGGALVVRSGGAEITYLGSEQSGFARLPNHLGFKPSRVRQISSGLEGTHLQVLLPLEPAIQASTNRPRSILVSALPESFRVDHSQIRGHLVPLLEALDLPQNAEDQDYVKRFRSCCERLTQSIVRRLALPDPVIIDFHGLTLTSAEFETLLYYLQNVIQNRPVLLVQLHSKLASMIANLEEINAETSLHDRVGAKDGLVDEQRPEVSERSFLETYRTVNAPVLGLDIEGKPYLFGMPTVESRNILLELIQNEVSSTLPELSANNPDAISALLAVLNRTSQLFESREGRWKCVWTLNELRKQAKRAMQHDFNAVLSASFAWRGREVPVEVEHEKPENGMSRLVIGRDHGPKRFSLPWQNEWMWVKEFLECSRILARGRYADEAAQILIFRLRWFLESTKRSLADAKILAAITAPGLLLATAMHRWWPLESGIERPAVLDLGYSMLHSRDATPPIAQGDSVVIVQDVLSAGIMSGRVISSLRMHGIDITALIAFIQLVDHDGTTVSDVGEWRKTLGVPHHALIRTKRGAFSVPPLDEETGIAEQGDSSDFWVEPRTLRPFQYNMLRAVLTDTTPTSGQSVTISEFETQSTCLVRSGHYVIGDRHHPIGIDVMGALQGDIGARIAEWIADLCQGIPDRPRAQWENERGFREFTGDVTIVLMPLNSQIHYLWPKVEELLAQRGQRQPMWLLDATLFLGSGPVYRLPLQLSQLLYDTAFDLMKRLKNKHSAGEFKPLRILILDDAMATGRTGLTILFTLQRAIMRALAYYGIESSRSAPIVQWIRYFSVFNRMSYHNDALWRSMKTIGEAIDTPFVFENYIRYIGFPPPDEKNCEQCAELRRIRLQKDQWRMRNHAAASWLSAREAELLPVIMKTKKANDPDRLQSPIQVLPPQVSNKGDTPTRYEAHYADTAISIFYTLMYQSYPPHDILRSILRLFQEGTLAEERTEWERYRWAVLEWCTRNWQRIVASGSRGAFFECARNELTTDSDLLRHLFYSLGSILSDSSLAFDDSDDSNEGRSAMNDNPLEEFIAQAIDRLVELETERKSKDASPDRVKKMNCLDIALNLFFLRLNEEATLNESTAARDLLDRLLEFAERRARKLEETDLSLANQLVTRWTGPEGTNVSAWTLRIVADYLFRARSMGEESAADHLLLIGRLRKVLSDPSNAGHRVYLRSSMGLFQKALEDLRPYMAAQVASFMGHANRIIEWLSEADIGKVVEPPLSDIRDCIEALDQHGKIATTFVRLFCPSIEKLRDTLMKQAGSEGRLDFGVTVEGRCENSRALVHEESLFTTLHNWTINPIKDYRDRRCKSHISFSRDRSKDGKSKLRIRIVSDFASPEKTERNIKGGHGFDSTELTLKPFDVQTSKHWSHPTDSEKKIGYTAACDLLIPLGYEWKEEK